MRSEGAALLKAVVSMGCSSLSWRVRKGGGARPEDRPKARRATESRECKSRVTLLLRDADSGQIDHMAAEPHPQASPAQLQLPAQDG